MIERREAPTTKSIPLSITKRAKVQDFIAKVKCIKGRMKVRKIAPSLRGVTEAAGLMGAGKVVFVPTESVYIACTVIQPSQFLSPNVHFLNFLHPRLNEIDPAFILLMSNPLSTLNRLACYKLKRRYAIQQQDNKTKSIPVVVFSEAEEVLRRLAKKFWPGPMLIYVNTENKLLVPLATKKESSNYVAISNPSHPLAKRIVRESYALTKLGNTNRVLVGSLSCGSSQNGPYMTKASDVSRRFSSKLVTSEDTHVHVIDGEDTPELLSVPTCQYGQPYPSSLWIDEPSRTLYIRGKDTFEEGKIMNMSEDSLKKTLIFASNCTKDDKQKHTDRVISSVLFKWKIVDERPK